jgi:hypothetical protein
MRVIEREQAHYEVQEVPYGKVYSWRPERVLFECECGETLVWKGGSARCRCGATYEDFGKVVSRPPEGEEDVYHPWLKEYESWRKIKLENGLQHEYYGFVGEKNGG